MQIELNGTTEYGEVWYYFIVGAGKGSKGLAMVSLYQKPDPMLYEESYQTLWACKYSGSQNLCIVPIEKIQCNRFHLQYSLDTHFHHLTGAKTHWLARRA
ncbi:hypothetical protein BT96DRAFT_825831 [Gymnopus androsaceus JB14]|uniref:Uncharacterized protein n=1 Tax=Gymnopus androsaceus JB14 TaxID=1447944 RepID=A0A6A4HDH7_9AGAR|nr:hypothetical protein BT96DRAFT_825831 [Gymnopus androsaceus JB14]